MARSLVRVWEVVSITGKEEQEIIKNYQNLDCKSKEYKNIMFSIGHKTCMDKPLNHQEMVIRTHRHQQNLKNEQTQGTHKNRVRPTLNEINNLKKHQRDLYLTNIPKAARAKRKRFNKALEM